MAHFSRDWICEFERRHDVAATEKGGFPFRDEGPVDRFDQAARGKHAPREPVAALARRENGLCHRMKARERNRLHFIEAVHAHHFFHEIGLAFNIGPPGWHGDGEIAACIRHAKTER